jgi:hypothetical protein
MNREQAKWLIDQVKVGDIVTVQSAQGFRWTPHCAEITDEVVVLENGQRLRRSDGYGPAELDAYYLWLVPELHSVGGPRIVTGKSPYGMMPPW